MDKEEQRNELRHKIKQKERQRTKTSTRINEYEKKKEPDKSNIESMFNDKQKENLDMPPLENY